MEVSAHAEAEECHRPHTPAPVVQQQRDEASGWDVSAVAAQRQRIPANLPAPISQSQQKHLARHLIRNDLCLQLCTANPKRLLPHAGHQGSCR
jgi:hypothetical protein